jgi:hypothetical protein
MDAPTSFIFIFGEKRNPQNDSAAVDGTNGT